MGEESIEKRSQDTVKLLNYGFNSYKVNVIKSKEEILGKVKVKYGKDEYVDVTLKNDAIELLPINDKISKYNFKLDIDTIKAPVKKGNVVGKVNIYNETNKLVSSAEITVIKDVIKANYWDYFIRNIKYILAYTN